MKEGCLHVYTGKGKGKTTAAVGLAVRARGQGLRVAFFQFLKNGFSGELEPLRALGVEVVAPMTGKFVWEMDMGEKAGCAEMQRATLLQAARMSKNLDLLVLDEVICATEQGLIAEKDLYEFIDGRPEGLELVLTGRGAWESLRQKADYLTEMTMGRHPYAQGRSARKGIEF